MRYHDSVLLLVLAFPLCAHYVSAQEPIDESAGTRRPAIRMPAPPELAREGLKPLAAELPDVSTPQGIMPPDISDGLFDRKGTAPLAFRAGDFVPIQYHWAASGLCHRPLYFEDAMLERYGQQCHPLIQPVASGSRFFLTFPALPYLLAVDPPRPAISTLGSFRPGTPAPAMFQRPPLQVDAGLIEACAWLAVIYVFP
ncbi:MAG: hypothetical protein FJ276_18495 [Planctomycetes bacterium]|nr:hypothetical protein [Planctomycetota bacterium]